MTSAANFWWIWWSKTSRGVLPVFGLRGIFMYSSCTYRNYKQNINTSMPYGKFLTTYFSKVRSDSTHSTNVAAVYLCSTLWNSEIASEIPGGTEHTFQHPALLRAGLLSTHAICQTNTIFHNIHVHVRGAFTVLVLRIGNFLVEP